MNEVHDGTCGTHQIGLKLQMQIKRIGSVLVENDGRLYRLPEDVKYVNSTANLYTNREVFTSNNHFWQFPTWIWIT